MPNIDYVSPSKTAKNSNMTWKQLLLGSAHNTGYHASAREMIVRLSSCVSWNPDSALRADCERWVSRCKHCMSVHGRPSAQPPSRPVVAQKPYHRVQIDLMEISPAGANGER